MLVKIISNLEPPVVFMGLVRVKEDVRISVNLSLSIEPVEAIQQ